MSAIAFARSRVGSIGSGSRPRKAVVLGALAATLLQVAEVGVCAPAFAQSAAVPAPQPPGGPSPGPVPPEQFAPNAQGPSAGAPGSVVRPPGAVDPGLVRPLPHADDPSVIAPPGSAGGDTGVQPK